MDAETFDAVVNVDKDIPTTGELIKEQLLFEAAQIRAAKLILRLSHHSKT